MYTYSPEYPPAHSSTYVKATSTLTYLDQYLPWYATDPALPVTGEWVNAVWISDTDIGAITNQKFNIDLGAEKLIRRVYLENGHSTGSWTRYGIKNVTLYGTNSATAFANTVYADLTDLTEIASFQAAEHINQDIADPQYFVFENSSTFRYYVFRIADCWTTTASEGMAIRQIELQSEDPLPDGGYLNAPLATIESTSGSFGSLVSAVPSVQGTASWETPPGQGALISPVSTVQGYIAGQGVYNLKSSSISGTATTPNIAKGSLKSGIKVNGHSGAYGHIQTQKSLITATGNTPIVLRANIELKKATISGTLNTKSINNGSFRCTKPKITGILISGPVGQGSITTPKATVSASAYFSPLGDRTGNILAKKPIIKGRLSSTPINYTIEYTR